MTSIRVVYTGCYFQAHYTGQRVQQYQLKYETITVDNTDFHIRSLRDRQQFYDHEQQAEALGISSATWSLFGVVWPSSRVLAGTVSTLELEGKRVIEIGCGLALSSIVLHRMGVDITACDYHPLAEEFLVKNIKGNRLEPIKYQSGNWDSENPLLGEFDMIIGSDVLYEPAQANTVSSFIDRHSSRDVEVIIVDPNRGNRACFTKKMQALGYVHHYESLAVEQPAQARFKGRVLHFQRH
jgi:predicted nicotinamide N-methyase